MSEGAETYQHSDTEQKHLMLPNTIETTCYTVTIKHTLYSSSSLTLYSAAPNSGGPPHESAEAVFELPHCIQPHHTHH